MPGASDSFKHESLQDCDSIVKYFNALSEGFCNGSLSFSTDSKRLQLKPRGLIRLGVEANRKGDQVKVSLTFRWSEKQAGASEASEEPLTISAEKNA
jgi:amphi-Trp domain-containing protein